MDTLFLFWLMIFLHIIDDYKLQGILANFKQKQWWIENAPDTLYEYDYIWALLIHSFSWSFMIMLPIAYVMNFNITLLFSIVFIANVLIHALVDDLKANKRKINLIQDQTFHLIQICITATILL